MVRKVTSLVALLAFILTVITSLILYIAPQGRVAYWSDWMLWGLDKTQWGNLHINLGTLFLAALLLHAYYNWKPLLSYLSRARKLVVFTPAFVAASVLVLVVGLGTLAMVPPFSTVLAGSEFFKDRAARVYGEPPYGHAELSTLASLAPKIGLTPQAIVSALVQAGYGEATPGSTLLALARHYKTSPQHLYAAFAPADPTGLPASPPAGTGNRTLAALCRAYGLPVAAIQAGLAARGIVAAPDTTIRDIGEQNGKDPQIVYTAIREIAATTGR